MNIQQVPALDREESRIPIPQTTPAELNARITELTQQLNDHEAQNPETTPNLTTQQIISLRNTLSQTRVRVREVMFLNTNFGQFTMQADPDFRSRMQQVQAFH